MFTLELQYPPSWNHFYSYVRGRPLLSKDAREYRKHVRYQLMLSKFKPMLGDLAVRIEISPPDQRRRDLDNAQKTILDALQNGGAFWDDSQIAWLLTVRLDPIPDGQATIQFWQLSDGALPQHFSQLGVTV